MDAAYALEGGIRRGLPWAWNYGGRHAVWLGPAGWRAARAGAVRGSARVLQGAEIVGVGTSWLGRRGAYDFARGYNATLGNRLGNTIAYGTGLAPYRPRPGNAGAPGLAAWTDRWPERRWAAAGLRLANAARFQRPALLPRYVPLEDRPENFDLTHIFNASRTITSQSFTWQWRQAGNLTTRLIEEFNRSLGEYLTPFTDNAGHYTDANGTPLPGPLPAFTINPVPPGGAAVDRYVDIVGNVLVDGGGAHIPLNLLNNHPARAEYYADPNGTPLGRVRDRNPPPDAALRYPEWYHALTGPNSEQAQQELLQLAAGQMQIKFLSESEKEQEKLSKQLTKKLQHQFHRIERVEKPQTYDFSNDLLKEIFNLVTSLLS